jgi:2-haloacid dehalogenase
MPTDRRTFIKGIAGTTTVGAISPAASAAMQAPTTITTIAFDAYGTLFDVFSVTSLCEQLFPGNGSALAQLWRAKQLQYTLLRSMMNRYQDFWRLTSDGLVFAAKSLKLDLTEVRRRQLIDAYLQLAPFPDAKPGLEALARRGLRLAVLSNGEPNMLKAAVSHSGLESLLGAIISVDELAVFKPDPRVYRLVGQKLNAPPDRIGFVSANSWDIHGAGSVGLHTFWIQRNVAEAEEELGFPAEHVVRALTDLEPLV